MFYTNYDIPLPSQEVVEGYVYEDENEKYGEIFEIKEEEIMFPIETDKLKTTSGYTGSKSWRTYTYKGKTVKDHHYGIDLVGGTKILAIADGRVVKVVNKGENGGTCCKVRIQHKDYQSAYYHCKSGSIKVNVGDYVVKGQPIATVGNTGTSTGPHLHFQIDKGSNATAIDPTQYAYGKKELVGIVDPRKEFTAGFYTLLKSKYARLTPTVPEKNDSNKVKYKNLLPEVQSLCEKDDKGYAKFKKGISLAFVDFTVDSKGRLWGRRKGKNTDLYACVYDSTGYQAKKN